MERDKFSVRKKRKIIRIFAVAKMKGIKLNMYKELVIIIIIIVLVIAGNVITQNNTNKTVETMSEELNTFRDKISSDNVNKQEAQDHISKINDTWDEKSETLAYYIEHDELEKVTTELAKLKADVETENYDFAIENLDNCVFILKHIKDKSTLKIVNVF